MRHNLKWLWIILIYNMSKIKKLCYTFKQRISILNNNQLKMVYKALVKSLLNYDIVI